MTIDNFEQFYTKFQVTEMELVKNRSWTWSLRPVQSTIGSGILSLNRYAERMSDLTTTEGEDLIIITTTLEKVLKQAFSYQKINYLMLMMVDPHIHFHVIPRYSAEIDFGSLRWKDNGWPALPKLDDNKESTTTEILFQIKNHLKSYL